MLANTVLLGICLVLADIVAVYDVNLYHAEGSERRYACWGRFGPPVVSAQCPRDTSIHISRAGLKVQKSGPQCTFNDGDCGCEYGEAGCQMPNVQELCVGSSACRLDVTQQYINTDHCRGFSDYMYIEFDCVPLAKSVQDICSDVQLETGLGFLRTPNFPHVFPAEVSCTCTLAPAHRDGVLVTVMEGRLEGAECRKETLEMSHKGGVTSLCEHAHREEEMTTSGVVTISLNTGSKEAVGGFLVKYEGENNSTVSVSCGSKSGAVVKGMKAWVPPEISDLFGLPGTEAGDGNLQATPGPEDLRQGDTGRQEMDRPVTQQRFFEVPTIQPRGNSLVRMEPPPRPSDNKPTVLPVKEKLPVESIPPPRRVLPKIELQGIQKVTGGDEEGRPGRREKEGRPARRKPVSRNRNTDKVQRKIEITRAPYLPMEDREILTPKPTVTLSREPIITPIGAEPINRKPRQPIETPTPESQHRPSLEAPPQDRKPRPPLKAPPPDRKPRPSLQTPPIGWKPRPSLKAPPPDRKPRPPLQAPPLAETPPSRNRDPPPGKKSDPRRKIIRHRVGAPREIFPTPSPVTDNKPTKEPWWFKFTAKSKKAVYGPTEPIVTLVTDAPPQNSGGSRGERKPSGRFPRPRQPEYPAYPDPAYQEYPVEFDGDSYEDEYPRDYGRDSSRKFVTAHDPVPMDADTKTRTNKNRKTPFRSALDPIPLHSDTDPKQRVPFLRPLKPIPLDEDTRRLDKTREKSFSDDHHDADKDDGEGQTSDKRNRQNKKVRRKGRRKNTTPSGKEGTPMRKDGKVRRPLADGGEEWVDLRTEDEQKSDKIDKLRRKNRIGRKRVGEWREEGREGDKDHDPDSLWIREGENSDVINNKEKEKPMKSDSKESGGRKVGRTNNLGQTPSGKESFSTGEESQTVTIIAGGVIGGIVFIIVVGVVIRFLMQRNNPARALKQQHKRECVIRKHGQRMMMARKKAGWSNGYP